MAEITLDKVVKKHGSASVVHGIDLQIAHEEFVVLVGPSGCGKSTTLRMIAGLEDISGGIVRIGDRVVNDLHALHLFEVVPDFFFTFKTNIVTGNADFYFHDLMTSY